jgi:CRP-like cAMP-binding protein
MFEPNMFGQWRCAMENSPPCTYVPSIFGTLPEPGADAIAGRLRQVMVPAGTTIVRQGAPAGKFFIIVAGTVEVVREDGDGERPVAVLRPGQFFGEIAILRDTTRTATVRAITDVSLLAVEKETLRSLVAQSLGITRDLDKIIQARMSALFMGAGGPG